MPRTLLLILTINLLTVGSVSAREATEQYRQLLTAVTYHDLTLGVPREKALSKEGGFAPFFLGMNACTRKDLGAPFHPGTELMLITAVHTGHIIGMDYHAQSELPAELAAIEAIKTRIEAIYQVTLPLDGEGIEKDGVFLRWTTLRDAEQKPGRSLTIYDNTLHDELRPPMPPGK